jgi:O-antigen ligase
MKLLASALPAALGVGVLAAATSPLIPVALLVAAFLGALIFWRPVLGVLLFVLVVATLPFGVIPLQLAGAQLTFVDAVIITTSAGMVLRWVFVRSAVPLDLPALALVGFVLVAIAALVAGGNVDPLTPELVRRTGKLLASLLFFVVVRAALTQNRPERIEALARALMLGGAVQGAIGTGLMRLSPQTQQSLLTRLSVIGYPTADVLRYVPGANDTYTTQLRAIGTSVDPNVFGGTLMLPLAVMVVQWASPRPVLPKWLLVLLAIPTATGVLLSLSRASWLGLAVGIALIGLLCYRRILVLGLLGALAVLAAPAGQAFITRFASGFSGADPATAFRFGEYGNALTLLGRYPLLGIGFGASPDIDVSAGVSSVYLLIAEQTGLIGLAVYVVALGATWLAGVRSLAVSDPRIRGIRAAFFAAFTGALVTGLLDQYFANLVFPHAVALFWLYAAVLVTASRSGIPAALRDAEPERAAAVRPATLRTHPTPVQ